MAQPFIAEKGVLRTSPLEKAVAARSVAAGDSSTPSTSSNSLNPANIIDPETNAPVDAAKLSAAQEAAAAGDKKSIDWLKIIGVGVGVGTAVGAGALYKTMKDLKGNQLINPRGDGKKPGLKDMGAKKADEVIASVPAKAKKKIDLYVNVPEETVRAGYIPPTKAIAAPPAKRVPKFTPSVGRDAMKVVRRLP
jgi:hypothetical protein